MSVTFNHLDYSMLTPLLYSNPNQSPNTNTCTSTMTTTTPSPYAFVLLNRPFEQIEFDRLWLSASLRIVVDGALNRLFTITQDSVNIKPSQLPLYNNLDEMSLSDFNTKLINDNISFTPLYPTSILPDIVIGDLDSAHPMILKYAQTLNVVVNKVACFETTDFQKTLNFLKNYKNDITSIIHPTNLPTISQNYHYYLQQQQQQHNRENDKDSLELNLQHNSIVGATLTKQPLPIDVCLCYNSFGGRFDQYMSIISTLHLHSDSFRIILLGDQNIVELIQPLTLLNLDHLQPPISSSLPQTAQSISTETEPGSTTAIANHSTITKFNNSNNNIKTQITKGQQLFQVNSHQVYAGIIPFLGATKCSWSGFEWDLGDESANLDLLQYIIENYLKLQKSSNQSKVRCTIEINLNTDEKFNEMYQNVVNNFVESGFDGLLSTNNWLKPFQIKSQPQQQCGNNVAFFISEKPLILSLSFHD